MRLTSCLATAQVLELIRDGRSVAELMTIGAQMLGKCVAHHCSYY